MVTFLTLFLGLVTGQHIVAVAVGAEVAEVDIELDGQHLTTLRPPRFEGAIDLGRKLLPHELVAVARDAEGGEVGRTRQLLNVPVPPAIASLRLVGDPHPSEVRVSWESRFGNTVRGSSITFDGRPVEAADPRSFTLPTYDPTAIHYLRVELELDEGVVTVAEEVFGGRFADTVASELTALAVESTAWRGITAAQLAGRFEVDSRPLSVAAIEEGLADLVLVVTPRARAALAGEQRRSAALRAVSPNRARLEAPFNRGVRPRVVWPVARRTTGGQLAYDLFPTVGPIDPSGAGLHHLLLRLLETPEIEAPRVADAVAVAGLLAAQGRRRRAVALLLDAPAGYDASRTTATEAKAYLEALQVPFAVWSTGGTDGGVFGSAQPIGDPPRLARALAELQERLRDQRVVLLEANELPHRVTIRPGTPPLAPSR